MKLWYFIQHGAQKSAVCIHMGLGAWTVLVCHATQHVPQMLNANKRILLSITTAEYDPSYNIVVAEFVPLDIHVTSIMIVGITITIWHDSFIILVTGIIPVGLI